MCKLCEKVVPAKGSNTSNLFKHLETSHPEAYSEARKATRVKNMDMKQPTIEETIDKTKLYNPNSSRAQELNRAVASFIASEMQPYQILEKPGFKKMISKLDPKYQLPTRKYFSNNEIPRMYSKTVEKVKEDISTIKYFAATMDLWTSTANHPYLSCTIHFINEMWELKSYCLDTVPLFTDHTGTNLSETLQEILSNWGLDPGKLVATTTDNGSNFIAAFSCLEWQRVSCFGHNLDLAISKALKLDRVQKVIAKCHRLVEVFSRSWKKNRDLRAKQITLGLKQHKLIADVVTRWGSTYKMMSRILEQQQAICGVLAEDRKYWCRMPNDSEFSTMESIVAVLEPLHVFTDALSGEKCITISAICPLLKHILEKLLVPLPTDSCFVKEIKETISDKLQSQYILQELSDLLDVSSCLDPRFQLRYVANRDNTIQQIKSEALEVARTIVDVSDHCELSSSIPPVTKKVKGLAGILKKIVQDETSVSSGSSVLSDAEMVEKETNYYFDLPTADPENDPLHWWRSERKHFPILAMLAQKYLCISGTSVPSERLFSKSGFIVNEFRSRLKPESVDKLVFLARNTS